MLISVIPIGNSRGIRLPKALLDQLNIEDKLELEVKDRQIILKPVQGATRSGWKDAFETMHKNNDDNLLVSDTHDTEAFEWEW